MLPTILLRVGTHRQQGRGPVWSVRQI